VGEMTDELRTTKYEFAFEGEFNPRVIVKDWYLEQGVLNDQAAKGFNREKQSVVTSEKLRLECNDSGWKVVSRDIDQVGAVAEITQRLFETVCTYTPIRSFVLTVDQLSAKLDGSHRTQLFNKLNSIGCDAANQQGLVMRWESGDACEVGFDRVSTLWTCSRKNHIHFSHDYKVALQQQKNLKDLIGSPDRYFEHALAQSKKVLDLESGDQ